MIFARSDCQITCARGGGWDAYCCLVPESWELTKTGSLEPMRGRATSLADNNSCINRDLPSCWHIAHLILVQMQHGACNVCCCVQDGCVVEGVVICSNAISTADKQIVVK